MYLTWSSLSSDPDPARQLLQDAATQRQQQARAPGTNRNHNTAVRTYIAFCRYMRINHLAPTHQEACMFIEYLALNYACPASTRNIVAHMRQQILLAGGPTDQVYHIRVTRALDGLDRTSSYKPQPRLPVPLKTFKKAVLALPATTEGMLVRAAVLTMFHAALRPSEVCPPSINTFNPRIHLTRADITFTKTGVKITIRHAKNAQKYNQTQTRHLTAATDKRMCPRSALATAVLLAPTQNTADPMIMFPDGNPVTSNYVAQAWSSALTATAAPEGLHRLHSLRKSAADAAYKLGATIDEVKDFGAWASNSVYAYVHKRTSKTISNKLSNALSLL